MFSIGVSFFLPCFLFVSSSLVPCLDLLSSFLSISILNLGVEVRHVPFGLIVCTLLLSFTSSQFTLFAHDDLGACSLS